MKNNDEIPPPDSAPSALDFLTEIALLKETGEPAEMKLAGRLFADLLTEYEPFLKSLIAKQLPFNGSNHRLDADDLYSDLVTKIWEKADRFSPKETTPKAIQRQFIGWSARILRNRVNDILASFKLEITETESIEALGWDAFAEDFPELSERAKILAEIMEEMDPDDAELIRWSALASPLDGSQMRTDATERNDLCRRLNVTLAGLRKRRERAFKALREEIESRLVSTT